MQQKVQRKTLERKNKFVFETNEQQSAFSIHMIVIQWWLMAVGKTHLCISEKVERKLF